MQLNESNCVFRHNGVDYVNRGAYIDQGFAMVYIKRVDTGPTLAGSIIRATDWYGNKLGAGVIVTSWTQWGRFGSYRMVSVRFTIDGVLYGGRFAFDNGELVRAKQLKGGIK